MVSFSDSSFVTGGLVEPKAIYALQSSLCQYSIRGHHYIQVDIWVNGNSLNSETLMVAFALDTTSGMLLGGGGALTSWRPVPTLPCQDSLSPNHALYSISLSASIAQSCVSLKKHLRKLSFD